RKLPEGIIVNVQGDEPEVEPGAVDQLISDMQASGAEMGTIATPFPPALDPADPNLVKVVFNKHFRALYFSRSLIPHRRDDSGPPTPYYLHMGVYAFERQFLLRIADW